MFVVARRVTNEGIRVGKYKAPKVDVIYVGTRRFNGSFELRDIKVTEADESMSF